MVDSVNGNAVQREAIDRDAAHRRPDGPEAPDAPSELESLLARPTKLDAIVGEDAPDGAAGATGGDTSHSIERGDTLGELAERFGTSVEALAEANGIADPDMIYAGDTLTIPADATSPGGSRTDGTSPTDSGSRTDVDAMPAGDGKKPDEVPAGMWDDIVQAADETGQDPYTIAAMVKKESQYGEALAGSPSAADGLMQVEPSTREQYLDEFEATFGSAYSDSELDQVRMGSLILADRDGDLKRYNGGENWQPGSVDSYGRETQAPQYEASVNAIRDELMA